MFWSDWKARLYLIIMCHWFQSSTSWNYFQITNKFRDEPHPKNALLRGREFIMKGKRLLVAQLQIESGFMKDVVILGLIRILNIRIIQYWSFIFWSHPLPDSVINEWVTPCTLPEAHINMFSNCNLCISCFLICIF